MNLFLPLDNPKARKFHFDFSLLKLIISNLLDRVSSVVDSPSTLSSNKLFFSRVRQGNVADFVVDDKQFELNKIH